METRGDTHPTVRITFTERHLILIVITGESLQNLQTIVNAAVIKVDLPVSVKECLSSQCLLSSLQKNSSSSLEMIRSFKLCWNDRGEVCFGSELRQNVAECLTRAAHPCAVSPRGIVFNLHMRGMSEEYLSARHIQYHHHPPPRRRTRRSEFLTSVMRSKRLP